nr:homeobox-DDT domain protein RLT1 isoform X2 [Ipomoea batatas]
MRALPRSDLGCVVAARREAGASGRLVVAVGSEFFVAELSAAQQPPATFSHCAKNGDLSLSCCYGKRGGDDIYYLKFGSGIDNPLVWTVLGARDPISAAIAIVKAWRFCLNFVDAFELWPFTLDEFVQGFLEGLWSMNTITR